MPFVIRGAASITNVAINPQRPRIAVPQVEWLRRLDIVVVIEEHGGLIGTRGEVLCKNHRRRTERRDELGYKSAFLEKLGNFCRTFFHRGIAFRGHAWNSNHFGKLGQSRRKGSINGCVDNI